MPNVPSTSTTPQSVTDSFGWLNDAPGGDMDFDALFPNPEVTPNPEPTPVTATTTTSSAPTAPAAQPQTVAPAPEQFFLHAPTGTVYKTKEEAEQGLAQKDSLIEDLRSKYIAITHTDPITGKLVAPPAQPAPEVNYARDADRLYDDAADAVNRGDKAAYGNVMRKFVSDMVQPYLPVVTESAKLRAQDAVTQLLPDYHEVVKTEAHTRALERLPGLKAAIASAESNPEYFGQLPELYQMEYLVTQALRSSETAQTTVAAPTQTPPSARPTVAPATMTPPAKAAMPNLATHEGRRAIIEQAEQKGLDRLLFGNLSV